MLQTKNWSNWNVMDKQTGDNIQGHRRGHCRRSVSSLLVIHRYMGCDHQISHYGLPDIEGKGHITELTL